METLIKTLSFIRSWGRQLKISSAIFVMLLTAMFLGMSMTAVVAGPPRPTYKVTFSGDIKTTEPHIQSGAMYRPNSFHLRDKSTPTLTLVGADWGIFAEDQIGPIPGNDLDLYISSKSGTVSIYFVFDYDIDNDGKDEEYRLYVSGEYTGNLRIGDCNDAEASIHRVVKPKNKPTTPIVEIPIVTFHLIVDPVK